MPVQRVVARALGDHLDDKGVLIPGSECGGGGLLKDPAQGGKEVFDVQNCYVCPRFGMPSPAARVESSHSTLRSALRALLAA